MKKKERQEWNKNLAMFLELGFIVIVLVLNSHYTNHKLNSIKENQESINRNLGLMISMRETPLCLEVKKVEWGTVYFQFNLTNVSYYKMTNVTISYDYSNLSKNLSNFTQYKNSSKWITNGSVHYKEVECDCAKNTSTPCMAMCYEESRWDDY